MTVLRPDAVLWLANQSAPVWLMLGAMGALAAVIAAHGDSERISVGAAVRRMIGGAISGYFAGKFGAGMQWNEGDIILDVPTIPVRLKHGSYGLISSLILLVLLSLRP